MKGKIITFFVLVILILLSLKGNALENSVYYNNFTVEADFLNDWSNGACANNFWYFLYPGEIWDITKTVGGISAVERWSHINLTPEEPLRFNHTWEIQTLLDFGSTANEWLNIQISNGTAGYTVRIGAGTGKNTYIYAWTNTTNLFTKLVNKSSTILPEQVYYFGQWSNGTLYFMNSTRDIIQSNISNIRISNIQCVAVGTRFGARHHYVNITTGSYTTNFLIDNFQPPDKYSTRYSTVNFNFSVNSTSNFTCDLIINDTINLSQDLTEQCYQETPTVSTSCGGLDNGTYWYTGNAAFPSNFWDGNPSTFATFYSGGVGYYSNYSKPINANSARWATFAQPGGITYNIPAACFNAYPNILSVLASVGTGDNKWYCDNGAGYTQLRDSPGNYVYEEYIIWNLTLTDYNFNVSFQQTFPEGIYNWSINCTNNVSVSLNSNTSTFLVDSTDPQVETDFLNKSKYYKNNLTAQFNFTDNIVLFSYNISIDNIKISNKSNISAPFYQYNLSYNVSNLNGATHSLFIRLADGHTAKKLKNESDWQVKRPIDQTYLRFDWEGQYNKGYVKIKEENYNLLDSWDYEKKEDRYIFEYHPFNKETEHTFEIESSFPITIVDAPWTKYKKWLIVDDHWLDFYVEGEDVDYSIRQEKGNTFVTVSSIDNKKPGEIKFNSIGDLNIITINYTFYTIDVYDSYEAVIIHNLTTSLNLTFEGINETGGNVTLQWNNTNYTSSLIYQNLTHAIYGKNIKDLSSFNSYRYVNHTWYFNLTNDEMTNVSQQIEYDVSIGECSQGNNNTFEIINISYYDELDNTLINVTNNYNLIFYDSMFYYLLLGTFKNNLTDHFCTNVAPGNLTYTWDYWNTYTLTKTGYVSKVIDKEQAFPYTCSNNPIQNLSLYMINISESSTITFTWLTTNYQPIDGTMLIYKCNIDGTKSLIESTPIISAEASGNIELLSGIYSYEVIINDKKYSDFNGYTKCHIESSTTRQFFVDLGDLNLDKLLGLATTPCTIRKIGNNTVNMTWGNNDNDLNTTVEGCILAYRVNYLGSTLIFENCSSTTKNLINSIPLNDYTYNIKGKLIQGSNEVFCIEQINFDRTEKRDLNFGQVALFGVFLLVFTLGMIYAGQPILMLISATVGFVGAFIFGAFIFNSLMPVLALVIFIGLIIIVGRYTRK